MANRKTIIVTITLMFATVVFAFVDYKPLAQDRNQQQDEEATPVQRGQVTDKERGYSKVYRNLYGFRKQSTRFDELIRKTERRGRTDEEIGLIFGEPEVFDDPTATELVRSQILRNLSCQADAVIIGSVINKSSHLTDDETFVYTEYRLVIHDVLKNNPLSPIQNNTEIEITRPGGLIKLDNRRIRVTDLSYEFLKKNKTYTLFLKFVPETKGYIVATPLGDFELENNSFRKLAKHPLTRELRLGEAAALINDIRNISRTSCK